MFCFDHIVIQSYHHHISKDFLHNLFIRSLAALLLEYLRIDIMDPFSTFGTLGRSNTYSFVLNFCVTGNFGALNARTSSVFKNIAWVEIYDVIIV